MESLSSDNRLRLDRERSKEFGGTRPIEALQLDVDHLHDNQDRGSSGVPFDEQSLTVAPVLSGGHEFAPDDTDRSAGASEGFEQRRQGFRRLRINS